MERPLSILLVEDDLHSCQELTEYTDLLDDVSLVGVTGYADKAIELLQDCLPDCLILDLELHAGSGDGLSILRTMKELSLSMPPYVLVTTNNSSAITYDAARQFGADFIFSKHQADYSAKGAIEFLRMIKDTIQSRTVKASPGNSQTETPQMRKKRLIRRIYSELDLIGISPKAVGYQYLADAIQLVMDKPEHHLPSIIGEKYGKSDASVERAMQNAIARAWRTIDIDTLYQNYTAKISSEKGVPTITEFVHYYANKLKNEF